MLSSSSILLFYLCMVCLCMCQSVRVRKRESVRVSD
jgi:hypothetical protein